MPYSDIISQLKEIKDANCLTNRDVSEGSGVPLGTVNRVFSGSGGDFRYETMQPIIRFLGEYGSISEELPEDPKILESESYPNHTAEIALYERMLELANQRHAEELTEVRKAHAERLEKQREGYEDRLAKLREVSNERLEKQRETSNERIREYRRWVKILSIALGVMVVFVMTMLVIDVLHPGTGWIQRALGGGMDAAKTVWHGIWQT